MKKCASELELEAFIREHLAAAEAEAEQDRPGNRLDGGAFSPGGGLPGFCFGNSHALGLEGSNAGHSWWSDGLGTPHHHDVSTRTESQTAAVSASPRGTISGNQALESESDSDSESLLDIEGGRCKRRGKSSDTRRIRRMVSNRESARRSRRRKHAQLTDLELQIMGDSGDEFFYKNFIDTSSDEESEDDDMITQAALLIHEYNVAQIPVYQGSLPGRAPALDRKRERGHDMLFHDYFYRKALFTPQQFRRRFRMSRPLFSRIMDGVKVYDDWFIAKVDAVGKVGLSSYQKCTAAIRMLAYGVAGDYVDEYVRMSESSCLDAMYRFCRAVIAVFGEEYLRQPTAEDTARLLSINASRGFPGMLGSIDCMHWPWKNCPFGWQGSFKGHSEGCTVILEAVASHDTWIWHSFFGMAGSHNDINVLQRSPVFDRLAHGQSPDVDFEINGHHYNKGYYLADGIYPPWATLVKTVRHPTSDAESRFAKEQEAARKDVERAFGILQARWAIVRHPARTWSVQTMWEVMTACVIMHNMIVEVERDDSLYDNDWEGQGELVAPQGGPATFQDILHVHHEIRDSTVHNQLQADLIAHMWAHVGHNVANEDNEEN